MTSAIKIHRQDHDKSGRVAVCGRKAGPDRMTDDPDAVTCVVCRTFATEARAATQPRPTAIDRLVDKAGDVVDMTRNGHHDAKATARTRAMEKLASRHLDEFRTIYRDELAAARLLEELDLLDP